MIECPTRGQLELYLRSEIPFVAEEALLDHLNHCEKCRATLEELASRGDSASEETPSGLPAHPDEPSQASLTLQLEAASDDPQQPFQPHRAPDTEVGKSGTR